MREPPSQGAEDGGADHVGLRRRAQDAGRAVAAAAPAHELHQALLLQLPHVVVHLLAGEAEPPGEPGRRVGLAQLLEQPQAEGVEEHGRPLDGGDHVEAARAALLPDHGAVHAGESRTDKCICQEYPCRRSSRR